MNFQKYKFLIVGGGICALLLAGGAFLLIKYRSGYVTVNRDLDQSIQTLSSLRNNRPFPSEGNIEMVNANLVTMRTALDELKGQMSRGQVEPLDIGRAEFPQVLEKTLQGLRHSATNMNVKLPPEGFDFGFERYAEGDLPDKDKVERLTTQLQIVAHLSELLFKSGVRDVLSVERDIFETVLAGGSMPGMMDPMMGGMNGRGGMMPGGQPGMQGQDGEENELYDTERITLVFHATDSALWRVLNTLGSDPMFATIVSVELRNDARPDGSGSSGTSGQRKSGGALSSRSMRGGPGGGFMADPFAGYDESAMLGGPSRGIRGGTASAPSAGTEPKDEGPQVSELSHDERVVAGFESVLAKIQVDVLMLKTEGGEPEEDSVSTEEATP